MRMTWPDAHIVALTSSSRLSAFRNLRAVAALSAPDWVLQQAVACGEGRAPDNLRGCCMWPASMEQPLRELGVP